MLLYKDRVIQTQPREVFCTFDPTSINLQEGGTGLNSPFEPLTGPAKSIYKDTFAIIGDQIPYNIQIYPSYNHEASPRVIGNKDYLIVNDPEDPKPYSDYLILDKNTLKEAVHELQDTNASSKSSKEDDKNNVISSKKKESGHSNPKNTTEDNDNDDDNSSASNLGSTEATKVKKLKKDKITKELLKNRKLIQQASSKDIKSQKMPFHSFLQLTNSVNAPVNNIYSMIKNHELKSTISGSSLLAGLRESSKTSVSKIKEDQENRLTLTNHAATNSTSNSSIANLSLEERVKIVDKIYNILGPNYDKTGITKEYINTNLDKMLLEYQNIWANKQKGKILLQKSSSIGTDAPVIKTLLKGKSPNSFDDFGVKLNSILADLKKDKTENKDDNNLISISNDSSDSNNDKDNTKVENDSLTVKTDEFAKKTELVMNSSPTDQTSYSPEIYRTIQLTDKNIAEKADNNELDTDDLLAPLSADADPFEKIKAPVMGPLVTNEVRSMFDVQKGKGKLAFSQNGTWDEVNIWQTLTWPDTCK